MLTFYICGYLRNKKDGIIRKNANRHVLAVAHSPDEIERELKIALSKYGTKYDYRIFDGRWNEYQRKEGAKYGEEK